jgi:outer membrane protein assembly factor BamB
LVLTLTAAALALTTEGDIVNPSVEFTHQPDPAPVLEPGNSTERLAGAFEWPLYGYNKARTRNLPLRNPSSLHPPYNVTWHKKGGVLMEFPPVLGRHNLYVLKNDGTLHALTRGTGRLLWKRKIGHLAAASPAYFENTLYAVLLERHKGGPGRIVALNAKNGHIRWKRELPSRAESSPLYDHGRIFFGSEDGTVYALDATDGRVVWTFDAPGAVKGGLAMDADRNLYYGTYGGTVQSLRAADGSLRWSSTGGGNFYSTPAVAYGRVYLGSTDSNVYSFGTGSGELAWRHGTGGYVYGSPAVATPPGGKPTVYIGSYDRKLYALDARDGSVRWTRNAEGRISGGAVVVGDMVFYSTLETTTTGVGANTGRKMFHMPRGAFNPVVSDGERLFIVGYGSLFTLKPKRR